MFQVDISGSLVFLKYYIHFALLFLICFYYGFFHFVPALFHLFFSLFLFSFVSVFAFVLSFSLSLFLTFSIGFLLIFTTARRLSQSTGHLVSQGELDHLYGLCRGGGVRKNRRLAKRFPDTTHSTRLIDGNQRAKNMIII